MKQRYRVFKRGWGTYYYFDNNNGQSKSLQTADRREAERLVHAMNEAERQPLLNRQMARAYLMASDPATLERTWAIVMDAKIKSTTGPTRHRWECAVRDRAFDHLRTLRLVETRSEHFRHALEHGTVSTNVFLRKLHNFALDMNWLLGPVLVKRMWPKPIYRERRAITLDEHMRIVERETNPERRAFYWVCWHTGGAQSDIAHLRADNINWDQKVLTYARSKTGQLAQMHFGSLLEAILRALPSSGLLFPYLARVREGDRATEFKQRCDGLGIHGVTLHSYRYAWAQRAKAAGYPERWAQQALGHASKAVHRAYAKNADIQLPSLEVYEAKVIPFDNTTLQQPANEAIPASKG